MDPRNSLVVQWLGLGAFTPGAWVHSLVGELRILQPAQCGKKEKKGGKEGGENIRKKGIKKET